MDERPPMERAMSTDVVMDIVLSHLRVRDLLSCRQVSKCWNKAASSVLKRRSTRIKSIEGESDLTKLQKCIKKSLYFPFTGLTFDMPWILSSARITKFLKNCGETFTSLWLGTALSTTVQDLALFVNHLPRLAIFEAGNAEADGYLESAAGQKSGQILKLPSLRIFRTYGELDEDFLRQVFTAASPSLRVECLGANYEILTALKNTGKLQALPILEVLHQIDSEHALRVDQLLSTGSPTLTQLVFEAGGCISKIGLINLLISSQHTLKTLRLEKICPSELLSECPVLANLTSLSVDCDQSYEYCFQGSEGHKFPALKELKLATWYNSSIAKRSDDFFIVPSVTTIDLRHFHLDNDNVRKKDGIEALARSFPNVIEIRLMSRDYMNDPSEIWSVGAFKFLEKLKIFNYPVRRPSKNYMNMDGFLTGIPVVICENLRKNAQKNLMDSPFNEILRGNPSILQLKNLKQLLVYVKLEDANLQLPEEPAFMSMVSLWYALDMMPNLQARFVYEPSLGRGDLEEEERDKAVTTLKTAFKHVHPHVKLEPFSID